MSLRFSGPLHIQGTGKLKGFLSLILYNFYHMPSQLFNIKSFTLFEYGGIFVGSI